jgi:hypothetical protein
MEDLREKVYECTLAVEAHMICDLLARGGVSARVDGEFLAGAGGDLPLGNTVKVRVDPAHAAEAREIIADWESLQPPEPIQPVKRPPWHSGLWFFAGLLVGGTALYLVLTMETSVSGTDYDGDGRDEETYHYVGERVSSVDIDSNADGKVDTRWNYDLRGNPQLVEEDADFDGRFERRSVYEDGWMLASTLDEDGNGRFDLVTHYIKGVPQDLEIYDTSGEHLVARQNFTRRWHTSTDFDMDGDGVFERHVELDRFGAPR